MQHCFYDYEKIGINNNIVNSIVMFIKRYKKIDIKIIKKMNHALWYFSKLFTFLIIQWI